MSTLRKLYLFSSFFTGVSVVVSTRLFKAGHSSSMVIISGRVDGGCVLSITKWFGWNKEALAGVWRLDHMILISVGWFFTLRPHTLLVQLDRISPVLLKGGGTWWEHLSQHWVHIGLYEIETCIRQAYMWIKVVRNSLLSLQCQHVELYNDKDFELSPKMWANVVGGGVFQFHTVLWIRRGTGSSHHLQWRLACGCLVGLA